MEIIIENMDVSVVYFFVGIFNNVLMRLVAFLYSLGSVSISSTSRLLLKGNVILWQRSRL